jgi:hypothetical protein
MLEHMVEHRMTDVNGIRLHIAEQGEGPEILPAWFTEDDLDILTESFSEGFTCALNWYRYTGRNWELNAPWHGAVVSPPALYVHGDRDPVPAFPGTPTSSPPRLL